MFTLAEDVAVAIWTTGVDFARFEWLTCHDPLAVSHDQRAD